MTRADLIAMERTSAATYRREAAGRRAKNPKLADQLMAWAEASLARANHLQHGPLFGSGSEQ